MVAMTERGTGSLNIMGTLPASIAQLPAPALADALGGPTLFDLRKPSVSPLFVSVLLHGNETSGWDAVRRLVDEIATASLLLFVGNVEAARGDVRSIPDGPDFNRVWGGGDTREAAIADEVTAFAAAARPLLGRGCPQQHRRQPAVCRGDGHPAANTVGCPCVSPVAPCSPRSRTGS